MFFDVETQQNTQCGVNNWVQYLLRAYQKQSPMTSFQFNKQPDSGDSKYIYKQKNKFHVCCKIIEKKWDSLQWKVNVDVENVTKWNKFTKLKSIQI